MISVRPALETDFSRILEMARSYDLDLEDVSFIQFVVAVQGDTIIGFGRLRQYPDCVELATVGVEPSERSKGVGGLVVRELIRRGVVEQQERTQLAAKAVVVEHRAHGEAIADPVHS